MKKWAKTKFKNLPISKKMLFIYICFAGIFFFIAAGAMQISFNIYSEKLYEKSLQELDFFEQKVNDGLSEIENLSYNIAMDTAMQENLSEMLQLKYPSLQYNQRLYKVRDFLLNELDPLSCVQSITYIDPNGIEQEIGTSAWTIPDVCRNRFFELAQDAKGAYVTYGPTEDCGYLLGGRIIRKRLDMSLDYMGTILITCDVGSIISMNKSRLEAPQAAVVVYSDDGIIYLDENIEDMPVPDEQESSGYKMVNKNGRKYFMCYMRSDNTGWMYVNYFPYSDIYGQVQWMRYILFMCFAGTFILLIICMRKVSKIITEPLEHLTESMQIVETGDFKAAKDFYVETDRNDEIGKLSKEFHIMVEQVDTLIKENYEKQLLLQDTKYKMLRAQINPHFLYNTLNVVNWMIKAKRNDEAGKMIVELGAILHYSFAQSPYATIKDELAVVNSYITIQRMRYQERIEFIIKQEGEVERYIIPRMIIQPLVENAISYGAEPYLDKCSIIVFVKEEEEYISIEVRDTGAGMTQEELEHVRNMDFKPKGHGIGLKNITERLVMDDGSNSFYIDSAVGKGTSIRININKKIGDGKNV